MQLSGYEGEIYIVKFFFDGQMIVFLGFDRLICNFLF